MHQPPGDAARVAVLVGALFGLAGTGSAAIAVALPQLAVDLGVPTGTSAWVISLYALTLAVTTAVYGRIADLAGIRTPLTVGVVLMAAGAALASAAPSIAAVLAARLLQGAGAAAVPTLGMALISARYDGRVRTLALSRVTGTAAAVTALGPLAGGAVERVAGWRGTMLLPALGLLLVPLLWRAIPTRGTGARLDVLGALLVAGSAAGLVVLVQSPSSGVLVAAVGVTVLGLGVPATTAWVRHRPEGFLPLSVITEPLVVRTALAAASIPAAWFALLVAVPAVLTARGWDALHVGLALVPSAAVGLLTPRFGGPVLARLGPVRGLVVAALVAAVAQVVCAAGVWLGLPVLLGAGVLLVTVAFGVGQPAMTAAVGGAVHHDVRGVALGIATLVFLVGGGVGSAAVGGLGELLGIGGTLALLALFPLVGVAGLRGLDVAGPGVPARG